MWITLGLCFSTYLEFEAFELRDYRLDAVSQPPHKAIFHRVARNLINIIWRKAINEQTKAQTYTTNVNQKSSKHWINNVLSFLWLLPHWPFQWLFSIALVHDSRYKSIFPALVYITDSLSQHLISPRTYPISYPKKQVEKLFEVSNLKTGNYFIKVTTDKGTATSKLIKE